MIFEPGELRLVNGEIALIAYDSQLALGFAGLGQFCLFVSRDGFEIARVSDITVSNQEPVIMNRLLSKHA